MCQRWHIKCLRVKELSVLLSIIFCVLNLWTFGIWTHLSHISPIMFLSLSAQSWETPVAPSNQSPNPNNPAEYCSTIPPLQQAQASGVLSSPPPTVMVPVGVLKQGGNEGTTWTTKKNYFSAYRFTYFFVKYLAKSEGLSSLFSHLKGHCPGSRGGCGLLMASYPTGTCQSRPDLQPRTQPPPSHWPSPRFQTNPPRLNPQRYAWNENIHPQLMLLA